MHASCMCAKLHAPVSVDTVFQDLIDTAFWFLHCTEEVCVWVRMYCSYVMQSFSTHIWPGLVLCMCMPPREHFRSHDESCYLWGLGTYHFSLQCNSRTCHAKLHASILILICLWLPVVWGGTGHTSHTSEHAQFWVPFHPKLLLASHTIWTLAHSLHIPMTHAFSTGPEPRTFWYVWEPWREILWCSLRQTQTHVIQKSQSTRKCVWVPFADTTSMCVHASLQYSNVYYSELEHSHRNIDQTLSLWKVSSHSQLRLNKPVPKPNYNVTPKCV